MIPQDSSAWSRCPRYLNVAVFLEHHRSDSSAWLPNRLITVHVCHRLISMWYLDFLVWCPRCLYVAVVLKPVERHRIESGAWLSNRLTKVHVYHRLISMWYSGYSCMMSSLFACRSSPRTPSKWKRRLASKSTHYSSRLPSTHKYAVLRILSYDALAICMSKSSSNTIEVKAKHGFQIDSLQLTFSIDS